MRILVVLTSFLMVLVAAPVVADQAEELVRQANTAVRHELATKEVSWLVRHYGHHQETLGMAHELAEFGVIHAEGPVAWEPRIVSLAHQLFTQDGKRDVALVRAVLEAVRQSIQAASTSKEVRATPAQPSATTTLVTVAPTDAPTPEPLTPARPRWRLEVSAGPAVQTAWVYHQSLWDKVITPIAAFVGGRAIRPSRVVANPTATATSSSASSASAAAD